MEQAKLKVPEIKSAKELELRDGFDRKMDGLKPAINNLLHMYLPAKTSIQDADTLAMVINDIIWSPEKYLKNE